MQFPWRPCQARSLHPIQQFYRFPRILLASAEGHEALSLTDPQCRVQSAHEETTEVEFAVRRRLGFHRRHRPRRANVLVPTVSQCGEACLRTYRQARNLLRVTVKGNHLEHLEEL